MEDGRWQRLKELFHNAETRAPEDRGAWLDEHCPEPELRAEVEALLHSSTQTPTLFEKPLAESYRDLIDISLDGLAPGDQVGPFTLMERVGAGGMGTVWKAEHEDRPGHAVALKFIRHGIDTPNVLRRFGNERRMLAGLIHPNIARLLDGGVTQDGRPYLVMDFVEGVPIDDYCDREQLDLEGRLQVFQQVCRAVEHAHANLIVHRDLKPENILVRADGSPVLLDFGISKILHSETGTSTVTATDSRPMTPQYASPEQVRGEPLTTASDVYSLGVLLYELLSGHRPYEVDTQSLVDAGRAVLEKDPERPSTAALRARTETLPEGGTRILRTAEQIGRARGCQPAALSRRLSGDLDNILLMALRKDAARRYGSVAQFDEDLDRHLRGLPVNARPDTLLYRMSKFVKRNQLGVAAGALVLISLLAGLAGTIWQANIADGQAEYARTEAESLHRVVDFLIDLFGENVAGADGRPRTTQELLESGVQRLESELQDQPVVRAALFGAMGSTFTQIGDLHRAEPLLQESLAFRLEHYGKDHPEIAESLDRLGVLRHRQGRLDEAEDYFRQAYAMWKRHWGDERVDVAQAGFHLALLLHELGQEDEALDLAREAYEIRLQHLGASHPRVRAVLQAFPGL